MFFSLSPAMASGSSSSLPEAADSGGEMTAPFGITRASVTGGGD